MISRININNYEAFLLDYSEGNLDEAAITELKAFSVAHPELAINLNDFDLPQLYAEETTLESKLELLKTKDSILTERILAYLDNRCDENEKVAFENDMLTNKQLQEQFVNYLKTILTVDNELVFDKSGLFKTEDDLVLANQTLAYFEKQLSLEEKLSFEKELAINPQLEADLALYSKTTLLADTNIIHPNKKSLKKQGKVILLFGYRNLASVAAAILLLVGFYVIMHTFNESASVKTNPQISVNKQVINKHDSENKINNTSAIAPIKTKTAEQKKLHPVNTVVMPKLQAYIPAKADTAVKSPLPSIQNESAQLASASTSVQTVVTPTIAAQSNSGTQVLASNDTINKNLPVKESLNPPSNHQIMTQLALAADEDDEELTENNKKTGFWQRVVKVAKRANDIGIKSIDGEVNDNKSILISFNSLSVEKK